ncbi:sorting nexin 1 sorting nexin 2 vacuolar protein sorting protein 5 [Plasmopara halstedii]|uniref:Sorting nexin 1 sorting nexin 2 vacuolar protein sorting protein 5 n=1 Tax=Plasmopara halstedii TaxID=4781 RepID=A0A0P1A522_PLAHL|nr:sorting nexin 1 sorting nexin 2 vacuolar protein sorting protein 5 [Plasmopara halstedii]CEG35601.1 sorting nexin 1 sorting nexin 2 vacuolar protein sorting protein 5 [Plasmopara halstedii]|eukprot:XP_024571970.1 sorting nexin 1 sorting nexin 2 vacuolar protein sorting protein 5 [Plasmopara halstedii]
MNALDLNINPSEVKITVGNAGKVGEGVNSYYVYKVSSAGNIEVDRRYSDFLWLHQQMSKQCAGYVIPPLPAKVVGLLQGSEFLEHRRAGLERFLLKVAQHDELRNSNFFHSFLECSVVELTALKAESQRANSFNATSMASVVQHTQQLNNWWGKTYQRMVENDTLNLFGPRNSEDGDNNGIIEDPEFTKVVKYVSKLYTQMKSLKNKVRAASQQNKLAAGAHCDLIECLNWVADAEEENNEMPTSYYTALLAILDTRARQMDAELVAFSASIDDIARWIKAVRKALAVREDRRYLYQAQLAAHRKAVSGDGPDSPSATRLSNELVAAKDDFERVHARVMREVARFRGQKAVELQKLFLEFAQLQSRHAKEFENVVTESSTKLMTPLPAKLMHAAQASSSCLNGFESRDSFGLDKEDVLGQTKSTVSTQSPTGSSRADVLSKSHEAVDGDSLGQPYLRP